MRWILLDRPHGSLYMNVQLDIEDNYIFLFNQLPMLEFLYRAVYSIEVDTYIHEGRFVFVYVVEEFLGCDHKAGSRGLLLHAKDCSAVRRKSS
jgi:hypothetical protein